MNIITKKNIFNILKLTLFVLFINSVLPVTFKAQNEPRNYTNSSQVNQTNKSENKKEQSSKKTKSKESNNVAKEVNTQNKNSNDSKPKTSTKKDSNNSENKQNTNPDSVSEKKVSEKTNNKSASTTKKETRAEEKVADSKESSEKKDNLPDLPALPEVNDSDTNNSEITNPGTQNIDDSVSTPQKANIWLTVLSWALIGIGIVILLKVLFDNLKVPKEFGPGIKVKHASQSDKRKNKYNFKIK